MKMNLKIIGLTKIDVGTAALQIKNNIHVDATQGQFRELLDLYLYELFNL